VNLPGTTEQENNRLNSLTDIMVYLAVSQLIFLGCCILLNIRRHVFGKLLALYCLCLISYILTTTPFVAGNTALFYVFCRLASATPAVLWIIALLLFADSRKVPTFGIGIIVLYMLASAAGHFLLVTGHQLNVVSYALTFVFAQVVMLGLSIHAIYLGIVGRKDDLVEERRRVRIPFVILMGILVSGILASGFLTVSPTPIRVTATLSLLDVLNDFLSLYAFVISLILNLAICTLHRDAVVLLSESARSSAGNPTTGKGSEKLDLKMIEKITTAMEEEKRYQQMGLTLTKLAELLHMPEYRLRNVINKQMRFRNFNQFLNSYRIKAASRLLQESDEPIFNIAMDVGYTSLSSFNKVFKDRYGVAPREFRLQSKVTREKAGGAQHLRSVN